MSLVRLPDRNHVIRGKEHILKKHKGLLIVIEGVDGAGKQTQSEKLYQALKERGELVKRVAYPRYDKDSSAMVRHYLNGDFGDDPETISPYIASTFYAADRYASYKEEIEPFLNAGGIVIADRYTTSNMVHQAGKIDNADERIAYLNWLTDYEFSLLGLPKPDAVFFLNMPPDFGVELIAERKNKMTGEAQKDIHESHPEHLAAAYRSAVEIAKLYHWISIDCVENGHVKSVETIHRTLLKKFDELFGGN